MSDILDRIRARQSASPEIPISIPEWGVDAFIRPLSAGKMMALRKAGDQAHTAAQSIIHGLVDKDGRPIFKDDAETHALLLGSNHRLIDRVAAAIVMADDTQDQAKNS